MSAGEEEEEKAAYKYTCEQGEVPWTPMNSNLHMQGIKVHLLLLLRLPLPLLLLLPSPRCRCTTLCRRP